MSHTHHWKHSALAAAILVSAGLHLTEATALTLGQVRVQSALGEPLRAQIPVTNLTENEADSLRANPASPDAFNQQGAVYSAIITQLQVSLQRRADGTAYLQLTTPNPVNEPFLDLVLNASWNGGQLVRSYALLLDPPVTQSRAPAVPATSTTPAVAAAATPAPAPTPAPVSAPRPTRPATTSSSGAVTGNDTYARAQASLESQGVASPAPATAAAPATAGRTRPAPSTAAPASASRPTATRQAASGTTVTARRGDTAGRIARNNLPANVSLDQMLVALQRANPEAFIQGNINLLRAGSTLTLPELDAIQAVSAQEARRIITAQTQDFRRYQEQVARSVPTARPQGEERSAAGAAVQAVTEPAQTTGPALVVGSAPADTARAAEETRLATERQAREDAAREAERQANIQKLEQLQREAEAQAAKIAAEKEAAEKAAAEQQAAAQAEAARLAAEAAAAQAAAAAPVAPAPAVEAPGNNVPSESVETPADGDGIGIEVPVTSPVPVAADSPAPAPEPVVAEPPPPSPAPAPPRPAPVAPPAPPVATGILDDYPMLPWGAGALALLLAGYGAYRYRKGRSGDDEVVYENSGNIPSSFFETGAKSADSSQDASNSTRSATTGLSTGVSSMAYSPSQIDATGEGDPVLEADVLLAYGRDQQAEEVLKEAAQNNPSRAAIKVRLAEIYAARQDRISFEAVATELNRLTQGRGNDWFKVAELGRNLDATNSLYQVDNASSGLGSSDSPKQDAQSSGFGPLSGLDFDLQPSTLPPSIQTAQPETESALADLDLDLNLGDITPSKLDALDSQSSKLEFEPSEFSLTQEDTAVQTALDSTTTIVDKAGSETTTDFVATDGLNIESPSTDIAPTPIPDDDALTRTLELDLSALSLDGEDPPSTLTGALPTSNSSSTLAALDLDESVSNDPLATKLALAKEFYALGDAEGARALVQEVLDQSSGELQQQAQELLNQLQ